MSIHAIETSYKGYRFRSRLEARWAVFFDALGVEWEYEKEGFDLGEAGWYLPDFWIKDWECWIEIKAVAPEDSDADGAAEWRKLDAFGRERALLLVLGSPWPGEHSIFRADDKSDDRFTEFAACRECDGVCCLLPDDMGYVYLGHHADVPHEKYPVSGSLLGAYQAARSARFEHGECGDQESLENRLNRVQQEHWNLACAIAALEERIEEITGDQQAHG